MSPTTQFRGKLTLARRSAAPSVGFFELQPERQTAIQDCESPEREEFAPLGQSAPSWLIFTSPLIASLLGNGTAVTLIACKNRLVRPGKSGKEEDGQPDSRKSQLNGDGFAENRSDHHANPLTASTKGSANMRISADEPSRGRP